MSDNIAGFTVRLLFAGETSELLEELPKKRKFAIIENYTSVDDIDFEGSLKVWLTQLADDHMRETSHELVTSFSGLIDGHYYGTMVCKNCEAELNVNLTLLNEKEIIANFMNFFAKYKEKNGGIGINFVEIDESDKFYNDDVRRFM